MADKSLVCVLVGSGAGMFALGAWGFWSDRKFFKNAIIVPGTITGYRENFRGGDSDCTMYTKIATFEFDGQKREVVDMRHSSSYKPTIGSPCQIGVNPNDINEARIYSKTNLLFYWIFILVGLLMIVLGIAVFMGELP
ncbi:MAG: DUF3592 domain-containing protein [Elusimicrobiaceae bacterium]|nr:DUF3592 domain-containing protein [Elusimicrobiaceae bacterium]